MTPLSCAALAVDEMGVRIDELENSIGELMAHGDARVRRHLLLRLLRPGGSHHRGGASIGAPASRLPVALASTDPGTNGPLSYIF